MKHVFLILFLFAGVVQAQSESPIRKSRIHILPDAPSTVYRSLLSKSHLPFAQTSIETAIRTGERNLAWLEHMNSVRPAGSKLQLTKPGDLKGIPIESPKSYNAKMVSDDYQSIKKEMPAEMKAIIFSNKPFPDDPPVSVEDYVLWANRIDKNYQTAVRWKMMAPWLSDLEYERRYDLRGFYFLSKKTDNVESYLRSVQDLPKEKQSEVADWLTQMCQNALGLNVDCDVQAQDSIKQNVAYEFYLKHLPKSQELWDSYFSLHNPRPEIKWTSMNPLEMLVPFRDPNEKTILDFLQINIEDEWKWDQWKLKLDFQKSAAIHVQFQSGSVPHVNGLGGDTIVMDKNAPLTEWDVQWTIRHEFGHVLGFTDCYLEFYEPKSQAIVTYQLDIENLMCARSGRLQKTHFETLQKSYLK